MIRDGGTESFTAWVSESDMPASALAPVVPLLRLLDGLNAELLQIDGLLKEQGQGDEYSRSMARMPNVGPTTAPPRLSVLDQAGRFAIGRQVASSLGLVRAINFAGTW